MSAKVIELKMVLPATGHAPWNKGNKKLLLYSKSNPRPRSVRVLKRCMDCRLHKPETEYHRDSTRADGLAYRCKSCYNQKRKSAPSYKKRSPWYRSEAGDMMRKWRTAINRAQKRSVQFHVPFNLKVTDLRMLWAKQRGICAISGVAMIPLPDRTMPMSVSLDRIKPYRGYVRGNIRLVGFAFNCFRGTMADSDMLVLAKAYVKFASKRKKK